MAGVDPIAAEQELEQALADPDGDVNQQLADALLQRDNLQLQLDALQNGQSADVRMLCGLVQQLIVDKQTSRAASVARDKPPELIKLEKDNLHDWRNCIEAYFGYKQLDAILTDPQFENEEEKRRAVSSIRATLRGGDVDVFRAAAEGPGGSVAAGLEALKKNREGSPEIRIVNLLSQVWRFKIQPGEAPRDAAVRMRELAAQLKQCGYELDERHQALALVFAGLCDKDLAAQTRNLMGLGLDVNLQSVVSALDSASKAGVYMAVPGALLTTGTESSKRPAPDAEANAAGPAKRGRAARGGRTSGGRRGGGRGGYLPSLACYNCNVKGHRKWDCPEPCQAAGCTDPWGHFTPDCPSRAKASGSGSSRGGRGGGRGRGGRGAFAGASSGLHKGKSAAFDDGNLPGSGRFVNC